jgi:hypothetical protein
MADQEKKETKVVRMQKLRYAVDRLRNIRSSGASTVQKKSWLARLRERLGLGKPKE